MFFVVSAMDKARDSLHMARLPLPSSDMSDQAAAQISYTENYARNAEMSNSTVLERAHKSMDNTRRNVCIGSYRKPHVAWEDCKRA